MFIWNFLLNIYHRRRAKILLTCKQTQLFLQNDVPDLWIKTAFCLTFTSFLFQVRGEDIYTFIQAIIHFYTLLTCSLCRKKQFNLHPSSFSLFISIIIKHVWVIFCLLCPDITKDAQYIFGNSLNVLKSKAFINNLDLLLGSLLALSERIQVKKKSQTKKKQDNISTVTLSFFNRKVNYRILTFLRF